MSLEGHVRKTELEKTITNYEVYVVSPLSFQEIEGIVRQRKWCVAITVDNEHRFWFSSPRLGLFTCLYERP